MPVALFFVDYRRRLKGWLEEACNVNAYVYTVLHARILLQALLLAIGFDTLEAAEAVYPFILVEHIESHLRELEEEIRRYHEDEAHDDDDDDDVTVACATDDDDITVACATDDDDAAAQY
jgi:Rad3-related DNA helicase